MGLGRDEGDRIKRIDTRWYSGCIGKLRLDRLALPRRL